MKKLRAAILGCGDFAHRHAEIISRFPDEIEVVAFADRNLYKAQAFAARYGAGARAFSSHNDLLDAVDLDLLVVVLPPYGHSDEVALAAERGIHLLVEKPIALTSAAAWEMVAAAEAAGVKTQVGFMYRFGAAVEALRARLDDGSAGPVGLISARYFCNSLHAGWWRDRSKSGGQLVEQVIHLFDLLRYLGGDVESVFSRQENLFHRDVPGYTVEDVSATVVSFASGALGVVYATNNAIPGKWINDYRLVAQNLTADFADANHATFALTAGEAVEMVTVASERDFRQRQLEDLLR
ncbi:MAG: Gfo/Idh/MocA family oxidoreductase, partial [Anaerolineae bacterium]|nr:Gfo/Idh/MocA family oxidoreductase [Anaerolineae bacterium]